MVANATRSTRSVSQSALTKIAAGLIAAVTVSLGGATYVVSHEAARERAVVARRAEFKQLGIDLAAASDYLTNEARKFSVNTSQKDLQAYWDEINVTKNRDRVVNRLKELGAPADELDLIEQAKKNSDALVSTESRSMRLVLEATGVSPSAMPPARHRVVQPEH